MSSNMAKALAPLAWRARSAKAHEQQIDAQLAPVREAVEEVVRVYDAAGVVNENRYVAGLRAAAALLRVN